jgi:Plasmid pRiA4b ORF-3-like protein
VHTGDLWPRPGRVLIAARTATFEQLGKAIDDAFARWDHNHLHEFTLADGTVIIPARWWDGEEPEGSLDGAKARLGRLRPGEQFAYTFDLGDNWQHLCTVAPARGTSYPAEPGPLLGGAVAAGDPVAVLPVLFGMLWRGELAADLERDLLGPATLVHALGACAGERRDTVPSNCAVPWRRWPLPGAGCRPAGRSAGLRLSRGRARR